MAFAFLSHVVADLTLGKPALFWLPTTSSVRDALRVLKLLADDVSEISVWECWGPDIADLAALNFHGDLPHDDLVGSPVLHDSHGDCRCVGKVCMQKILCYLASDESLCNPAEALHAPVTILLSDGFPDFTVQHVDPQTSLLETLQLIAGGVQKLVVPITSKFEQRSKVGVGQKHAATQKSVLPLQRSHNGQEYCWLTHEDVLRFLLGSISVFSPLPMMSIEDLGIIETNVRMVSVDSEAASALGMIKAACLEMTAVAVVDDADDVSGAFKIVGDISCTTLLTCNETAALALATLSVGDFLMYAQDCRNPADSVVDLIRTRLYEKLGRNKDDQYGHPPLSKSGEVNRFLQDLEMWEESCSDGDESGADSPTGPHDLSGKWLSTHFRACKMGYSLKSRSGPIFCNPKSSLVAVVLQALAHRENYVWATREDGTLLGIVTFFDILTVMLHHVNT